MNVALYDDTTGLAEGVRDSDWQTHADCRLIGTALFFASDNESTGARQRRERNILAVPCRDPIQELRRRYRRATRDLGRYIRSRTPNPFSSQRNWADRYKGSDELIPPLKKPADLEPTEVID